MTLDISAIIADKLAQLEEDGTIKRKIEEALEKSVLEAITSELSSWEFRRNISGQMKLALNGVAESCGLSAYNGFIAEKVRTIVQETCADDITAKVQAALDGIILKKYEDIKLSDIFKRYREWVLGNTDEADKYERQNYTAVLNMDKSGSFTHYKIQFADRPGATDRFSYGSDDCPDIEIWFLTYEKETTASINTLYINGHDLRKTLKVGGLTSFEAFLVNLYYNGTKIQMDVEDVDDSDYFDIDI